MADVALQTQHTPTEEHVRSIKVLVNWAQIPDSNTPLTDVCFLVLQVPGVRARTVATINVTIQGESASMSKKTKVLIEPPAFIHIIQTDKPIYKPGQTGKSEMLWHSYSDRVHQEDI